MSRAQRVCSRAGLLVLALLIGACHSGPASSGRTVQISELPEEHIELLADYGAGGARWEARRAALHADPALLPFLIDNLVLEMVRSFDSARFARAGDLDSPFERAQAELVRFPDHAVPVLTEMLAVADGPVAFVCAQTLVLVGSSAVVPVLRKLDSSEWETRRRAAVLLEQLPPEPLREAEVSAALAALLSTDPEWIVRVAAAKAIGARAARAGSIDAARVVLERALADEDQAVLRAAALALGDLHDPRAIPALLNALEKGLRNDRLGEYAAARGALRRLLGEDHGMDYRAWRNVWRKRRGELLGNTPNRQEKR